MRHSYINSKLGFTLLELIISITMIGLIILITAGAMRLGHSSIERGDKKIEDIERIKASINIIDSQIQSIFPLTEKGEDGEKKYIFKGERNLLKFGSNYSIWRGIKGYSLVEYKIENIKGKSHLVVSESIIGIENKREINLFNDFDEIDFEYFQKDSAEDKGQWVSAWSDDKKMPFKIKINLLQGKRKFSFIIPVKARPLKGEVNE